MKKCIYLNESLLIILKQIFIVLFVIFGGCITNLIYSNYFVIVNLINKTVVLKIYTVYISDV